MATPAEKIASSPLALHSLQEEGKMAILTDEITRIDRQRLLTNGFLKEVTRGWYIIARPEEKKGYTTSWYHSFWNFCARFLQEKFNKEWCISAEQSVQIHAGNWNVPTQLIVKLPMANNFKTELLFDTSLFLKRSTLPVTT